jgi:hypothetical protein
MRHFVAYHIADKRGPLDRTRQHDIEAIGSKKSLKALQAAIGSRVWLFEGRGTTTGKPIFSLAYSFVAETAEDAPDGEEKQLSGSSVIYFEDEVLNDLPWFKRLKIEVANFSLGFQEVKNSDVIAQLAAYLATEDHADFTERTTTFTEGGRRRVEISVRERSASARLACIRNYGTVCFVCGFNFGQFYGTVAEGFIEVHHRKQISESSDLRVVDAVSDLIPLCANCHRIVHLASPPIDVDILKEKLRRTSNTGTGAN